MTATAERIGTYAGTDPELRDVMSALVGDAAVFAAPMPEPSRKQAHFASANLLRSRDASGHSVKRA